MFDENFKAALNPFGNSGKVERAVLQVNLPCGVFMRMAKRKIGYLFAEESSMVRNRGNTDPRTADPFPLQFRGVGTGLPSSVVALGAAFAFGEIPWPRISPG